jgi:hypothetical protein
VEVAVQAQRGETGATGATGAAGPNEVTSATTSDGTATLSISTLTATTSASTAVYGVSNSSVGVWGASTSSGGVYGSSSTSSGVLGASTSGAGVRGTTVSNVGVSGFSSGSGIGGNFASISGVGLSATTTSGEFHASFGLTLAVPRTGGIRVGSITNHTIVNGAASGTYSATFPNASGTIALTSDLAPLVINASATATAGRQHINVATATYTDPTPSEGAWFRVIVRNGDATVGGTAYATSGTVIERSYHSGAWANRVYNETPVLAANVATFLQTPSSANLAAAVTDETGTGSLVFATSPTIVTPTIQQINVGSGQCLVTGTGASGILQLRATSTAGFSSCDLQNTSGTQVGGFGYGGATAGAYTDQCYFYGTNRVLVLASQITQRHLIIDLSGRIGIGNGISTVNAAAQLQVDSTTRGFLPPRMTTAQRDAITSVPAGLMVYNTTTNKLNFYNGSAWEAVTSA